MVADVRLIRAVQYVLAYHAVILGNPTIMGWRREAVRFPVKKQQALALFLLAAPLAELQS
jgi:hypothetical protein